MNRNQNAPLLAILVMSSLLTGMVLLLQVATEKEVTFVNRFGLAIDYLEVYRGGAEIWQGGSPYRVARYVYPPLPAIVSAPVTALSFETVRYVVPLLILVAVVAALFLVHRVFAPPGWRADGIFLVASVGVVASSYPFLFLFNRGNLDGFALLLAALGLYFLRGSGWLAGVLFALAVAVKLYPVLLVLPLVAQRRWKPLAAMAACGLALFAVTPGLWLSFLQERVLIRGAWFRMDENGSIACTFRYLGRFVADGLGFPRFPFAHEIAGYGIYFYLVLLALLFVRDALRPTRDRKELCAGIALYFPFMVAVPQLAYHYELVWLLALIPVVGWLWSTAERRAERAILVLIVLGIGLSQFQAVAAEVLLGVPSAHFVPGFGLLLVMIGVVALKWTSPRTSQAT